MASDGLGIKWNFDSHAFTEALVGANEMQDKATKYALRATGRAIARAAKAQAPVYSGDDSRVTPGLLKKSIANPRTLTGGGGAYELKVGPFGSTKKGTAVTRHGTSKGQVRGVPLYRAKMEAQYGYMAAGVEAANSMQAIYEDAIAKALAKFA